MWSLASTGLTLVALSLGGVRLVTRVGSLVFPVQVSQPKLPGFVPLRIEDTVVLTATPASVCAERAMG
jgi:hypothetical protein